MQVVTYKYLSRSIKVHVNAAKQMLFNFVEEERKKKKEQEKNKGRKEKEEELRKIKKKDMKEKREAKEGGWFPLKIKNKKSQTKISIFSVRKK